MFFNYLFLIYIWNSSFLIVSPELGLSTSEGVFFLYVISYVYNIKMIQKMRFSYVNLRFDATDRVSPEVKVIQKFH